MDFSDHSIGPSTSLVEGLPSALSSAVSTEPLALEGEAPATDGPSSPGVLRLVSPSQSVESNGGGTSESVDQVGPVDRVDRVDRVESDRDELPVSFSGGQVLSLFGEVADDVFPEVSANHPARSMPQHPSRSHVASADLPPSLAPGSTRLRSLQAATPPERSVLLTNRQAGSVAPGRSRSYERRRPGSVGGVQTRVVPRSLDSSVGDLENPNDSSLGNTAPAGRLPNFPRAEQRIRPAVIDLCDAEVGQTVKVRKSTAIHRTGLPSPARQSSGTARKINYFEGHEYGQATPVFVARPVADGSETLRVRSVLLSNVRLNRNRPSAPRQRRTPLGVRLQHRTGLSQRALTGLGFGAVSLLGVGLVFSPLLALHRVDIRRAGSVAPRVRAAAQLQTGQALVSLDIAAVQRRIVALPEIAAAKVERKWPRGVRITVTTRTTVVALAHADRISLVAADGTVLRDLDPQTAEGTEMAFLVDGVTYRPIAVGVLAPVGQLVSGATKRVVDLVAALAPDLRDRVVSIAMTGSDLTASISSAGKMKDLAVHFGDEHDLELKARALGALLGAGSATNVAGIDLTVPDAPVLRLTSAKARVGESG